MQPKFKTPIPDYPWPTVSSPIVDAFDVEEIGWYDNDYTFTGAEGIKRYKRQKMSQVATFMSPTTTNLDHMRPIARFMIYITVFDDYFELTPLDELRPVRDRVFEVMMGEDPRPDEIGILRQMAYARKEWLTFMPQFWIERISTNFYKYITYGVMAETPFKLAKTKTYPSLAYYLLFRQYSIGMMPYGDLIDPATNFALPVHIYKHPIIQRLKELLSLLIVIQNDLASLKKEMARETEIMNIVPILQHEYNISLEEACAEAIRMHEAHMVEMNALHTSLPDFSPYQQETDNYVYHMKLMVSGCGSWYYNSGTNRYNPHGFIVPQYGQQDA